MIKSKSELNYVIFIFCIYLFIFKDAFVNSLPLLRYVDELFALMSIPCFALKLSKNDFRIRIKENKTVFLIVIFCICGFTGNLIWKYQPLFRAAIPDFYLNLKFWLAIYVGGCVFSQVNLDKYGRRISRHIVIIMCIWIILIFGDYIIPGHLFEANIRYGLRSTQLYYEVHTFFAAACAFLISMLTLVKRKTTHFEVKICILLIMLASTLRSKAFGAIVLYIVIYFYVFFRKKKINAMTIVATAFAGLIIAWTQIQYYFFSNIKDDSARNVLLLKCFKIAKDYFPFGAGFGTYASHYSGKYYSPLYSMYSLSFVHGLKPDDVVFVSDTFWPMIIGQNGYIGLGCYVLALMYLLKKIIPYFKIRREYYAAALFALGYLGISSLAESAFVNSFAIPLAMVIGMIIYRNESEVK